MADTKTNKPCIGEGCGKDTGVVVSSPQGPRERQRLNKKGVSFVARDLWEPCGDDGHLVKKKHVFPNNYLLPVNMDALDMDLGIQTKESELAGSPIGYTSVVGYKPKISFTTSMTENGPWEDFLWGLTVETPLGDEAEVTILNIIGVYKPTFDEKGRVTGGEGLKAIKTSGPLDIAKFGAATGNSEEIAKTKITQHINYAIEPELLKPANPGDWDELIKAIGNASGLYKVWDNTCPTKLITKK